MSHLNLTSLKLNFRLFYLRSFRFINYKDFLALCFPTRPFYFTNEISKYTKENMQADCFGSHFSHNGLINLISQPGCHIFTDTSLDTHINMNYVCHLSSVRLTDDIIDIFQMSVMTDDGHKSY